MRWMAAGMLGAAVAGGVVARAQQANFTAPTPQELSMTSLPGFPGAAAVVLNREETTKDDFNAVFHYERIKILTKEGEKYANVELGFISTSDYGSMSGDNKTLEEIAGRTIHPDGKIIPFTGKPYLKVIEKEKGVKLQQRIFTLPDVEVGSIIEYRYATRIADNIYEAPDWLIQGELYVKAAHYAWYPTSKELSSERGMVTTITWFPILPPGVKIQRHEIPHTTFAEGPVQYFDLTVNDVPPQSNETFMPPIKSYSYRVLFNFTAERTNLEWWKNAGKDWSKRMDAFADPNSQLKKETATITAGATTDDEKLKKIYAAVMGLENTHFTRQHDQREEKAEGGGQVKNAFDVLSHKRGTQTQLTQLFVGMARAAGMKAYFMDVPDRSIELFTPAWLSFQQFDDEIAIVNVDGKERYFDPGCRYCAYGHLAWQHTTVGGLRQVEKGTDFGGTPADDYTANQVSRVANLRMDAEGQITGKIDLSFTGADAVEWRHKALSGDQESLDNALRTHLESMVPKSLQVKVDKVENLTEYDQPLNVSYQVTGTMGTHTGKRIILPSDLFLSGSAATFTEEKREQAVYFEYPRYLKDAVRVNLPDTMVVEGTPATVRLDMAKQEVYAISVVSDPKGFTTRRNHLRGEVLVAPKDYDELRKYYAQFESKDQESVVLKAASAGVAASGN